MSKIPSADKKTTIKYKWYKNVPPSWIQETFKEIIQETDGKKKKSYLDKKQIVMLINKHGLPDFATMDDYNEYVDDPSIKEENSNVKGINIDLD